MTEKIQHISNSDQDRSQEQSFVENKLAWVLQQQMKQESQDHQQSENKQELKDSSQKQYQQQESQESNQFNHLLPTQQISKKHNNLKNFMFHRSLLDNDSLDDEQKHQNQNQSPNIEKKDKQQINVKRQEVQGMKIQYKDDNPQDQNKLTLNKHQNKNKKKKKAKKYQPQLFKKNQYQKQEEQMQTFGKKKPAKIWDLEKDLRKPIQELSMLIPKLEESKQIKKQNRRVQNMIDRRLKQYKHGKKNDQLTNQVFNFIEQYFN